jgi:hypothetical protein
MHTKFESGCPEVREHLRYVGVDWRRLLKYEGMD